MTHTVEKIGGTSIADSEAALNNVFLPRSRKGDPYNRIFVVSAYAGMTNELLEDKKTKDPGVYTLYSHSESDWTIPACASRRTSSCWSVSRACAAASSTCSGCAPTAIFISAST